MKVAIAHYHLKTGGVGTVIKRQVAALQNACATVVLTGNRASADLPCTVLEIAGLGYERPGEAPSDPDCVAEKILQVLSATWPGGCDVLHVHNPTLGKNRHLLGILRRLQQAGVNLFLQIHDFAEDGRPDAYVEDAYPADCHYGVINTRDAGILRSAGLTPAGLHYLPNAVENLPVIPARRPEPQVLYPVRAIRRKNLGEALLLSLFFRNRQRLVVTQPPNSVVDMVSYRDWTKWAQDASLQVQFEAGKAGDYAALVGRSASVVTTSIAEGFGLAFLEPWTAGKLLWGRRIADVCRDFESNGVRLDGLYDRFDIPLSWIDIDAFAGTWHRTVKRASARYGHDVATDAAADAFARLTGDDRVDFGVLSEKFQRAVLERLLAHPSARMHLIELNPWLADPGLIAEQALLIETNRQAVARHYQVTAYRRRLLEIYRRVIERPVRHRIDKAVLQRAFFDLDRFSLLKWGAYEP